MRSSHYTYYLQVTAGSWGLFYQPTIRMQSDLKLPYSRPLAYVIGQRHHVAAWDALVVLEIHNGQLPKPILMLKLNTTRSGKRRVGT